VEQCIRKLMIQVRDSVKSRLRSGTDKTEGMSMKFSRAAFAAGVLAAGAFVVEAHAQPAMTNEVIAIKAGRMFDANKRINLMNQVILVQGDKITAVGPAGSVAIPAGARVIDLSTSSVVPGMMDTHLHLYGAGRRGAIPEEKGKVYRQAIAAKNARANLMAGFTSVVDLGQAYSAGSILELRKAIEDGLVIGPRIQAAGIGLKSPAAVDGSYRISNPEEGRLAVIDVKRSGYDWVKFYNGSAFSFKDGKSTHQSVMDRETVFAIVDEAKKQGLRTACHAYGGDALRWCIEAGATNPQHAIDLDETPDVIKLIKDRNSPITATVLELELQKHEDEEKFAGDSRAKHGEKAWKAAYAAGVDLPMGSGAGPFPHGTQARQLKFFTDWGGKPGDVLATPTILSAEVMGIGDKAGSIDVGKWADIIAVQGDPFVDMAAMQNVGFVMKGGKVYKDELSAPAAVARTR